MDQSYGHIKELDLSHSQSTELHTVQINANTNQVGQEIKDDQLQVF
jgi:hypothetical protein